MSAAVEHQFIAAYSFEPGEPNHRIGHPLDCKAHGALQSIESSLDVSCASGQGGVGDNETTYGSLPRKETATTSLRTIRPCSERNIRQSVQLGASSASH